VGILSKTDWHSMRVIDSRPPNFDFILSHFPSAANPGVLFCYGDAIYAPGVPNVQKHLVEHEAVHSARQQEIGVEDWWQGYCTAPAFRLFEESIAHVAEYEAVLRWKSNPGVHRAMLKTAAERLSGPLYNNMIGYKAAVDLISTGAHSLRKQRLAR
jgi:hypothetical protein